MAEDPFKNLKVSPEAKEILSLIAAESNAAYRENFDQMVSALRDLAEGQKRLQVTLGILIKAIEPKLAGGIPAAVSIALPDQTPDIASAVVLADPQAAGFTLTQAELAKRLGLSGPDVSILVRAFRLDQDRFFAIRLPRGKGHVVWYRPEAEAKFRELVKVPPEPLSNVAQNTLTRVRKRLA